MIDYAPVYGHGIIARDGGVLLGIAYPMEGERPSAIGAYSGEMLVAAVRADRFQTAALNLGIRSGWCGFSLELSEEFFLRADVAELRCLVSGARLRSIPQSMLDRRNWVSGRNRPPVLVNELLMPDPWYQTFEPFEAIVTRTIRDVGLEQKITFLYRFLMRREPDPIGLQSYMGLCGGGLPIEEVARRLLDSEEFAKRIRSVPFSSVFDSDFPGPPVFERVNARRSGDISRRLSKRR